MVVVGSGGVSRSELDAILADYVLTADLPTSLADFAYLPGRTAGQILIGGGAAAPGYSMGIRGNSSKNGFILLGQTLNSMNYDALWPDSSTPGTCAFINEERGDLTASIALTRFPFTTAPDLSTYAPTIIAIGTFATSFSFALPGHTVCGVGRILIVKDEFGSASPSNTITITGNIDGGSSSVVINQAFGSARFYCTGGNPNLWYTW